MNIHNHDGTEASAKAYSIFLDIELLRNKPIPWVKNNTEGNDRAERMSKLKEYERKLLYDLGMELGNENTWENVY